MKVYTVVAIGSYSWDCEIVAVYPEAIGLDAAKKRVEAIADMDYNASDDDDWFWDNTQSNEHTYSRDDDDVCNCGYSLELIKMEQ